MKHDTKPTSKERLDVDIRFLLANERTLLAWIRTGLALQAGGLALAHFGDRSLVHIGIGVTVLGALTTLIGYFRFRSADQAIRAGRLPNPGIGPVLEVSAVTLVAVAVLVAYR